MQRRDFVKMLFAASALALVPIRAFAAMWNATAFESTKLNSALTGLGISEIKESKQITIIAPDKAENGAVVPLGASTPLSGVKQLLILVEKNPAALVAMFYVSDAVDANFTTRAKMGQSSDVYAIAIMNDGKALWSKKEVKVTLGGCGG